MKQTALFIIVLFYGVLGVGTMQAGDDVQSITPGIDTLAPQLSKEYRSCGVYEFVATEVRNYPDPPTAPPKEGDQVEKGIASVTISNSPTSINAKLTLVTDNTFPKDDSYKQFIFRIEPIDPSKRAVAYVWVRDWAGNVTGQEIMIEPSIPSSSDDNVALQGRVNTTINYTVTLTNETPEPQTVDLIELTGSARFSIVSGGSMSAFVMQSAATRTVIVAYTPDLTSEAGDAAVLHVRTACGDKDIPMAGLGLVGKLNTEDWNAGEQQTRVKVCKAGGFSVTNNGTADVTITGFISDNPNVTIVSNISAANPTVLAPTETVSVTELCYERATEGTDVANVSVTCNAESGDALCIVTASAKEPTSVDPETLMRLNVRFDASTEKIRFESNASAILYDVHGSVIGIAVEGARAVDARSCSSGTFFLVLTEDPNISIPVSIVR